MIEEENAASALIFSSSEVCFKLQLPLRFSELLAEWLKDEENPTFEDIFQAVLGVSVTYQDLYGTSMAP